MSALTRWTPSTPFFSRRFDRLFDDFLSDLPSRLGESVERDAWLPAVDIREAEDAIFLDAELPGVEKGDVEVSVENNRLTLTGERKFENEEKRENYHRIERGYGHFSRSFTLPSAVDREKVEAKFKNGVLTVRLPKSELAKARRIEIN